MKFSYDNNVFCKNDRPLRRPADTIGRRNRRAENKWKDVRCLDADDLEQWAERTLSAAFWPAEQMGLASSGFITAQRYWDTWANTCKPHISRDLILAGRSHEHNAGQNAVGPKSALRACSEADFPENDEMPERLLRLIVGWRHTRDAQKREEIFLVVGGVTIPNDDPVEVLAEDASSHRSGAMPIDLKKSKAIIH